jgi:hypothetical protein
LVVDSLHLVGKHQIQFVQGEAGIHGENMSDFIMNIRLLFIGMMNTAMLVFFPATTGTRFVALYFHHTPYRFVGLLN